MRHPTLALLAAVVALLAATAPATSAASRQFISAAPDVVAFGQQQVIRGHGWVVFENCERHVRLRLRSPQNSFLLGTAHVRRSGRFRFAWTPRRARVGAGRWRLVVLQRCTSGRDGSPFFLHVGMPIRIVRHH